MSEDVLIVTAPPPTQREFPQDYTTIDSITVDGTVTGVGEDAYIPDIWLTITYKNGDEPYENGLSLEEYQALRKSKPELSLPEVQPGNGTKVSYSLKHTGNTMGRVLGQPPALANSAEESNPKVTPESPEEESEGSGWLDGAQLSLDAAGLLPGFGAFFDVANAGVSLCRGDFASAAFSLLAAIPVVGDAAAAVKMARKGVIAIEKKAAKEVVKKAEKEAAEKAAGSGGGRIAGKGKKGKGPCDHLKKGSGKGDYRGGAHSETSRPAGDGLDSHHMPADDVSPLSRSQGPAIQMDPSDHKVTRSNGSSHAAFKYRKKIEELLRKGEWRKAMAIEIWDIKSVNGRKYNEAIKEMLLYFKCLDKNNLLK
ncbi:hypothetical protein [Hafnia paralvei]|uniref:hypothetical protein n=1 Tax=Hafnia paralvei TaxID=546367 RepID=UPI003C2EF667